MNTNQIISKPLTYFALPLIIFLEGFVSIAIEILTIRQLLPVAGGSVIVTSLIIGVFLLFLAWGYRTGGRIKQYLPQSLRRNFMIAASLLGIGLSYPFISLFFYVTQKIMGVHIIYPLISYLLFILAPLIYLLGQTVPITMNMAKQNQSVGMIGGDTLSVSTLGSFLGAILTTLLFMHYFGVAWTLFINVLCLLLLSFLLMERNSTFIFQILFSFIAIVFIYTINIDMENKLFTLTNNYANYQIWDRRQTLPGKETFLQINDSPSSFINEKKQGYPYIERIKKILFQELHLRNADILVLGAGGFTLSAENNYHNQITYVDIDKQIKNISIPKFISKLNGEFIADDARHYLITTKKRYQAIVVDVYSNTRTIPAHLLTSEYIQSIQNKLLPEGTVIFNMIAKPTLSDLYSKRIDNTIRMIFKNCMVIPLAYSDHLTNILYVCHHTANQIEQTIYTDNRNHSTTDSFDW